MPKNGKRAARGAATSKRRARPQARKQPETLRLTAVTPSMTVNDIQRSVAWYRDVLGFTVGDRWQQDGQLAGAELKAGSVAFILNQDDFAKGRDRKKGEGFRLYCSTRQDVDLLAEKIKARGGVLAAEPKTQPWGVRDFMLVDPDGFKLTITSMG